MSSVVFFLAGGTGGGVAGTRGGGMGDTDRPLDGVGDTEQASDK